MQDQSSKNQTDSQAKTSQYRGVSWIASRQKWEACISIKNKTLHLGKYDTEVEAARAYNAAVIEHGGNTDRLNVIAGLTHEESIAAPLRRRRQPKLVKKAASPRKTISERFWDKVLKTDSCWLWLASKNNKGYGRLMTRTNGKSKQVLAHQASWIIHNGQIPSGLIVCHNCPDGDNPACVNPEHLFLGTSKDNTEDAIRKNRLATILSLEEVSRVIRRLDAGERQRDIARSMLVPKGLINAIAGNKSKQAQICRAISTSPDNGSEQGAVQPDK